jgi:hypothetical protein
MVDIREAFFELFWTTLPATPAGYKDLIVTFIFLKNSMGLVGLSEKDWKSVEK